MKGENRQLSTVQPYSASDELRRVDALTSSGIKPIHPRRKNAAAMDLKITMQIDHNKAKETHQKATSGLSWTITEALGTEKSQLSPLKKQEWAWRSLFASGRRSSLSGLEQRHQELEKYCVGPTLHISRSNMLVDAYAHKRLPSHDPGTTEEDDGWQEKRTVWIHGGRGRRRLKKLVPRTLPGKQGYHSGSAMRGLEEEGENSTYHD